MAEYYKCPMAGDCRMYAKALDKNPDEEQFIIIQDGKSTCTEYRNCPVAKAYEDTEVRRLQTELKGKLPKPSWVETLYAIAGGK
jgi:hypothetical protein